MGLKNKQYCIFNKQYTKEEWYEKVDELFGMMEDNGTLGDFFPAWINPFYFNDTAAHLIGDFDKNEVHNDGYLWRESNIRVDIPEGVEIVQVHDLHQYE